MNSSDLEKLLAPLAPDSPCGPDLEYDAEFAEMERAAQGKPEQQFGSTVVPAEPPDWKILRKHVQNLLERTKDLRVAAYLARCSLNLDGLLGFQLALALLRGYLETYWDSVHPELDHSDNDDPTYRTNTLLTLCDETAILRELRETPLVSSRALGRFSLRDIEQAGESAEKAPEKTGGAWSEAEPESSAPGPTLAVIEAAFTDTSLEDLQATAEATRLSSEHVTAIEMLVTDRVGVSNAVSLAALRGLLSEMSAVLMKHLERRGVYANAPENELGVHSEELPPDASGGVIQNASGPSVGFNGKVNTREEAMKALDGVCKYYEENEPSSPLPLLIRRARRLASKSFIEILRDLTPDAVTQAEALGGVGDGQETVDSGGESKSASKW